MSWHFSGLRAIAPKAASFYDFPRQVHTRVFLSKRIHTQRTRRRALCLVFCALLPAWPHDCAPAFGHVNGLFATYNTRRVSNPLDSAIATGPM